MSRKLYYVGTFTLRSVPAFTGAFDLTLLAPADRVKVQVSAIRRPIY